MKVDALILESHAPSAIALPSAAHIEATSDAAASINMIGLAVTLACAVMALGLGYSCYARTNRVLDSLSIAAMVFLPLRMLLWIAIRN